MRGSAALAVYPPRLLPAMTSLPTRKTELWFSKPASRWMEALPIGNGRIGGMIFGGVSMESIALTESTVWSGAPSDRNINPTAFENLGRIRELMFAGKYAEGGDLCKEHLLGHPDSFGTNLPMATLQIAFDDIAPVQNYRRSLNLDEAIAHVDYTQGGLSFHREIFSSNTDDALIARLTCSKAKSISCTISFAKLTLPGKVTTEGDDTLILRGQAFEHLHSNGKQGVEFEAHIRLRAEGGVVTSREESITVKNADALTILVVISTNYGGADPSKRCTQTLQALRHKTVTQLRSAHLEDHRALYRRVAIDLGTNPAAEQRPTDERRKAVQSGGADPGLSALFFQYGRYLTIAGSRPNSPLPLALQGIWNDGLASSMGWTDDFHLDINTEQNYWVAEVGNLSECQSPLFDFIDAMRVAGRITARKMYGAPGWVSHVVTNPWGFTAAGWGLGWGIFPTGGVWLSLQLLEHYRFTADKQFMKQRLYPVFKEAAEFFLAYMVQHPQHGWLVTGPAVSPENWFLTPDGKKCSESMGPTADRVLVHSLLNACIEASTTLGIDEDFRAKAKDALDRLPPLQIGKHGQLQEWLEDFDEAEPNHRSTTHLIALYPEHQISPAKTPALAQAARITIERRISQPNWEDSEWGRANLVNYYARLLDGEAAHKHLIGLLSKAAEDSLLTYSRGGVAGAESNIFSLDGNCAGAAGIAEMLLQSHEEEIHLLPALPSAWPQGSIHGLCARGGVQVSLSWVAGKLIYASFKSKLGGTHKVRYGTGTTQVSLIKDREVTVRARSFNHG
ncbi:glycoside hydrolase N-terminal domain-containing protein [Granulicella sp. dw_53]|uniref:glycoside hydrolase family 95 protein n=1 Tax=Granulicella sp. dw_53 TaxID=2719792 RepID=UPI001BD5532C